MSLSGKFNKIKKHPPSVFAKDLIEPSLGVPAYHSMPSSPMGGQTRSGLTGLSPVVATETHIAPGERSELKSRELVSRDLLLFEVECARVFSAPMANDLADAVEMLEESIETLMGVQKSVVLVFHETSGTYRCLNDEITLGAKVREMTQISDSFLKELLDTETVIQSCLMSDDQMVGIVAVGQKQDGLHFTLRDEYALDVVARYLTVRVTEFQRLKQTLVMPYVQDAVLDVASHLMGAPDQAAVIEGTLASFIERFDMDVCQYVALDHTTGEGWILHEVSRQVPKGQTPNTRVQGFANLVSLFSSSAWKNAYLHLQSGTLGDHDLKSMFGLKVKAQVSSALLVPVLDSTSGRIQGAFALFFLQSAKKETKWFNRETIDIIQEIALMVSLALGRTQLLERAMTLAVSDELTGLTNRRGFYERFELEIERVRRNPAPLCVAMVDVDFFKQLNDTYGHLCGDRVLRTLAEVLSQNVRKTDMVSRFGGEEFAILLPDTSIHSASELMERIRRTVEQLVIPGPQGEPVQVTISAGITRVETAHGFVRPLQEIIAEALSEADAKLYEAKALGRNQVAVTHLVEESL